MKRMAMLIASALIVEGCAGNHSNTNLVPTNSAYAGMTQAQINNEVQTSLSSAATLTQQSLNELASIEKMRFQKEDQLPLSQVQDPALNTVVNIKWYGPIAPVLSQIASLTGYQFESFGKPPFSPILINVDDTESPEAAISLLRNINVQAGLNAQIMIFPDQKIISLRYAGS